MEAAHEVLAAGCRSTASGLTSETSGTLLRTVFLLTDKPVLAVVNLGEDQIDEADAIVEPVADELGGHGDVLAVSGPARGGGGAARRPTERAELLEGLGLGEGALPRVARGAYHLLGRRTFLTTGDKESRAWSFRAGATAPECAGRDPLRPAAGLHPGRGDPLGRAARDRLVGRRQGGRTDPPRGQGVRRARRRRARDPLQRLSGRRSGDDGGD